MNSEKEVWKLGRIVPVVVLEDQETAPGLAEAIYAGGIFCAEITLRTPAAYQSIEAIAGKVPEIIVGAGTVLNVAMAKEAVDCGAQFIVSPGLNAKVVSFCREWNIPVFPGVSTPSEIMAALELGIDCMKFFPAEQSGGIAMLKALASPFGGVRFMPTGGIGPGNLLEYLKLPNVVACGGSFMCPEKLIQTREFGTITDLCRRSVEMIKSEM